VLVNGDNHLFFSQIELLRGGIDNALVGLMGDEPIDVFSRNSGFRKLCLDDVGDHADSMLEDLPALHSEMANGLCRGRSAINI